MPKRRTNTRSRRPTKTSAEILEQLTCSLAEAAQVTSLCKNTLDNLCRNGRLASISVASKPGTRGRRLVVVASLRSLVEPQVGSIS